MDRNRRQAHLKLEPLEVRYLLHPRLVFNGGPINDQDLAHFVLQKVDNQVPVDDRHLLYTTPQGTKVAITLFGLGSLQGSTVSPDGVLDLQFHGTDASSGIVGRVTGGTGSAKIIALHDSKTELLNLSGNGVSPLGVVNLKNFDLVNNGFVNLTGGIGKLFLRSAGPNTQIHVKALPVTTTPAASALANASANATAAALATTTSTTTTTGTTTTGLPAATTTGTTGIPTTGISTSNFGAASNTGGTTGSFGSSTGIATLSATPGLLAPGSVPGSAAIIPITGNAGLATTPGLLPAGTPSGGGGGGGAPGGGGGGGGGGAPPVTDGFGSASITSLAPSAGANVPASVVSGGVASANAAGVPPASFTAAAVNAVPPGTSVFPSASGGGLGTATGVDLFIDHLRGAPRSTPALSDSQIFAYDPVQKALIRFDAVTGAVLQTITPTGMGTDKAGVALGRNNGHQVALISDGTIVQAYDVITGNFVGQFTTANLEATTGLKNINAIASTNNRTVIFDTTAGTDGLAILIDVTQSLAAGQAVPTSLPFAPEREFELSGGATGLAGTETIYATGAAHFDTFQPDKTQFGFIALSTDNGKIAELGRAQVTKPKSIVDTGLPGEAHAKDKQALGSIDQALALITDDKNTVTLYDPKTLTVQRTLTLQDPNPVAGLSESFHPELAGEVLIDVNGDLRSIHSLDARSFVINDNGSLGLAQIHQAVNGAIVGRPVNHVNIPLRRNVLILSTARIDTTDNNIGIGSRNGVTINKSMPPLGPLALP